MNLARRMLLSTYFHATIPWRLAMDRVRRFRSNEPVQILFYHRVADNHPNPWTIGHRAFEEQINWLARRFDVVSLTEAQRRIIHGKNRRPTAVITFDDGYADNMHFALPLLIRRNLPFTYFVTTGNVYSGEPFPHDVKRGEPLAPNTEGDIRELAMQGVEIGAHTRTHADLARLEGQQLIDEIAGSKKDLESMTGREVQYFAFPYGQPRNLSPEGFRVALEAGFSGVCSAYGGYNFPGGDPFHLERFHADPDFLRFRHWLSVDGVKQIRTPSFDPELPESDRSIYCAPAEVETH
ncbi:polysaccharide deacetylase family protein [Aeoliella sp. ICT_H6.2]|uniref:Polysaccharide deacetylase family protein n=1 Tax=Aeoliella straminimaris TaxID=2954799 RepID=A0A9X2FEM3_9BACT|nr:polysaccharide deacetylase family protein [Aeoliella straminimaris]MCO6047289.1 polysaccharide deacetylase family protein [Aeoliella straminimaris]